MDKSSEHKIENEIKSKFEKYQVMIKNITVKKILPFNDANNETKFKETFTKCMDYIKMSGSSENEIKHVLPLGEQYTVGYQLSNTTSDFANAINRCMKDELTIYSLTCESIDTDDDYILKDNFTRIINSIPIRQPNNTNDDNKEITELKKCIFHINVKNNSEKLLPIYSSSIIGDKKNTYKTDCEFLYSQNIKLLSLLPFKYLKADLTVISGINRNDGASFSSAANITYIPISTKNISTMMTNYSMFDMRYTTYRNSTNEPFSLLRKTCQTLIKRLDIIQKNLSQFNLSNFKTISCDKIKISYDNNIYIFTFIDEYWTLINLISRTCFQLNPEICFISPGLTHPSIEIGLIKLKHDDPINILIESIKLCIFNLTHILAELK